MPLLEGLSTQKLEQIIRILEPALNYIMENVEHQNGGVFCIAHASTGTPLFARMFGCITIEECDEYLGFALEKARRLAQNITHLTSAQSRDMSTSPKRYGGAVRGTEFIFSFSGFTEEQDEAVMLFLEVKLSGGMDGAPNWLREHGLANSFYATLQVAC